MTDIDETYAMVVAVDTPPRLRSLAALDVLVWLAKYGDMSFTYQLRAAWTAICKAVLQAELDSYQTLLIRMETP